MEQNSGAVSVAKEFGELSAKSAAAANFNRRMIAEGNIAAGTNQLRAQETQQRRQLAQEFARFEGTLAANSASRAATGRSADTAAAAASLNAGAEGANITGNRAAQEAALIASQNFIPEDVGLAGIRGALEGFALGQEIQSALFAQTKTTTKEGGIATTTKQLGPIGTGSKVQQTFKLGDTTTFDTPGFDLGALLDSNPFGI